MNLRLGDRFYILQQIAYIIAGTAWALAVLYIFT